MALFLDTTRDFTVPQISAALTTTSNATAKQFFIIAVVSQSIKISQRSVDTIEKLELTGKVTLYAISQG